jgi:pimeloyl-ACP methyl ester carboxylesterase
METAFSQLAQSTLTVPFRPKHGPVSIATLDLLWRSDDWKGSRSDHGDSAYARSAWPTVKPRRRCQSGRKWHDGKSASKYPAGPMRPSGSLRIAGCLAGERGFPVPVASDVPTPIQAGAFDPLHPPAWGPWAAESLSRSQYVEFPGFSHRALGAWVEGEACWRRVLGGFLANLTSTLGTSCLAGLKPAFETD